MVVGRVPDRENGMNIKPPLSVSSYDAEHFSYL